MKLLALLTLTSLSSLTAAAAIGGVTTTDSDSDADSASNLQSRADDGFGPLGKSDKLLLSCGRLCFGPRECGDLCPYCNPRTHNCEVQEKPGEKRPSKEEALEFLRTFYHDAKIKDE